jgi:FecR-like protein
MTTTERDDNDYLWDGSGEPDPEIVRLERLLGELRHRGSPPELPSRVRSKARFLTPRVIGLAAAAVVLLAVGASAYLWMARGGWSVHTLQGTPIVGVTPNAAVRTADVKLRVGEWLVTDAESRARVAVGSIGSVDVEPNTRVQLVEARGREHRMSLERGTIHARIWAPPKLFFVNTPSATAVDLGCEYTLAVDDFGAGLVRVLLGWVALETTGRQALVPQGAMCATRPGIGPGTPRYADAPPVYAEALNRLDFGAADDPDRAAALHAVISAARPRDGLTLWHMLSRGTPEERAQVYDRLAALSPPPPGVTRAAVLAGNRAALDRWWNAIGENTGSWWNVKGKW